MIKILNKSGAVVKQVDADTLRGVDLSDANLRYADLIIITWSHWHTYITPGHMRIGCQFHSLDEWRNFTDDQIAEMHGDATEFWAENKELLIGLCERFEKGQK